MGHEHLHHGCPPGQNDKCLEWDAQRRWGVTNFQEALVKLDQQVKIIERLQAKVTELEERASYTDEELLERNP